MDPSFATAAKASSPRSAEASPSSTCIQLAQKLLQMGKGSLVADNIAAVRADLIIRVPTLDAKEVDPAIVAFLIGLRQRLQQPAVVLQAEEPPSFLTLPTSPWHGFPIQKITPLAMLLHELKGFIDLIAGDSPVIDLRAPLERIVRQYETFLTAYVAASDELKAEMGAAVPEITGDSIGFYLLDYASALAIVCRDKYGFISKENEFGNHPVRAMGGIHFKPNPKGLDFLGVAEEFMVHSLGEILSGNRTITAPTSLLKVSHVPMVKVSKHPKKSREAYKALMDAMVKGSSAAQIFEENDALFETVEKKRKDFSTVIQAGLSIDGVLLLQLLEALQHLEFLNSRLTPQCVVEVLPRLMSDCFQSDLFDDYSHFRGTFNPSLLYESYLGFSATLSPDERFVEFQQLDAADSRREHVFMKLCKRNRPGMLAAFALVKKFPALMKGAYLGEIQRIPASIALLQTLLPSSTPAQIMETAPKLLERLDMYSYSAIFVLSLLTSPSDGKADNYMVKLEREADGNVKSMRIVGIDNDKAFEPAVRTNKLGQIYPGLKSIIPCLPNAMLPVDNKFRAALVGLNPELVILQWLAELHEQNQRYARLESLGILTENDKIEKKTATKTLDIPIQISSALLQNVFEKLLLVHRMLSADSACTHRKLLEAVEPLLARYYHSVLQTTKSPLEAQRNIYHGDYMTIGINASTTIGNTSLSEEAFGLAVRSPTQATLERPANTPLETVIKDFVGKLELGNLDPTSPAFRAILTVLTSKFPFVKRLPFNTIQLNGFLLHTAQNSDDTDLALFDFVLRAGPEPGAKDEVGRTALHLLLNRPTSALPLALIKRLLAEKDLALEEKDAAGQKPVHVLLKYLNTDIDSPASSVLVMLQQTGVDIDGEDTNGDSIIRQAIKRDMPSAFARLALLGAGRQLLVAEVKPFVERYMAIDEWKKEMRLVTKALVKVNHQIALEYGIRSLLTPLAQVVDLALGNVIIGLESGKGVLKQGTAERLFEPGTESSKSDTTNFLYFTPCDQTVIYSVSPKYPLLELTCQQLAVRMFGYSSPQCELFRAERTGLPVLVYQHVDGFPYSTVISDAEKRDTLMKNIDMGCFSEMVLLQLVTLQEVLREDLYLVPHFSGRFRMFCLRNRTISPDFAVRKNNEWVVQHRNYVFCMDQLTSPLDGAVRQRFLALDIGKALTNSFTDLVTMQKRCEDLFGLEKTAMMSIPYRLGITSQALLRRLQVLQTAISDTPASSSMLDLLSKVNHMLGAYYRSAFRARKTPDSRYEFVADRPLSSSVEESFVLPVEVFLNQPLFELPLSNMEEWAGKVDMKQEVIYLSRLIGASRTVRQLVAQLNTGQADLSLIGALDEDGKARLLHKFNWTKLGEDKQKQLFDTIFPRSGTWALKCLYLDSFASLDSETLGQCLRQDRGAQLVEISLTGLPLIDVHKVLNEISRRSPNVEKLRLVRLGVRSLSSSSKGGTETTGADPGKLLRFSAVRLIHIEECHKLEFCRLTAPELRVLELIDCDKLQGFEVFNKDQRENLLPLFTLASLSVISCPNVTQPYVDNVVVNAPYLRAVRFSGVSNPSLLSYYFSLYNTWSPMNVTLLLLDSTLNLSGSPVNDAMLERIIPFVGTVRTLDLSGCVNVTSQSISAIIASCPNLDVIRFASPTPVEERVTKFNPPTCMQLLPTGRLATGQGDGQVRVYELGNEMVEKKESALKQIHSDSITVIENGPFGQFITGSQDKALTVVQYNALIDRVESTAKLKGHDSAIRAARFLGDGNLATVSADRTVKVWEVYSARCLRSYAGDTGKNSYLAAEFVSRDRFVGGGDGALLSFFSVELGKEIKQVISDNGSVHALRVLSSDTFASGGSNGRVKVWNSTSGECLFTMTGHTGTVKGLEKLPLSRVASYTDNTVRVWDHSSGVCLNTIPFNTISITGLRFLPDGRLLISTAHTMIAYSLQQPIFGKGNLNLMDLDFLRGVRFMIEQDGVDSLVLLFLDLRGAELTSVATSLGSFLRPLLIGDSVKLTASDDRIVLGPLLPASRRQELQVLMEGIFMRSKERAMGRKLRMSAWNVTRLQITGSSTSVSALNTGAQNASGDVVTQQSSGSPSPSTSPKGGRPRADGGRLSIMATSLFASAPYKSPSPPGADSPSTRKPTSISPGVPRSATSVFLEKTPNNIVDTPPRTGTPTLSPLKMPASSAPVPIPSPPNSPPREPAPLPPQVHPVQPTTLTGSLLLERAQLSPHRQTSRGELYSRPFLPSTSPIPSSSSSSSSSMDMRPKVSASPARPIASVDTPPSTASALEHTGDGSSQPGSWVPKKTPTQTFLRGVKGNRSSSDPMSSGTSSPSGSDRTAPPTPAGIGSPATSTSPLTGTTPAQTMSPAESTLPSPRDEKPAAAADSLAKSTLTDSARVLEQPKLGAVRMMAARRVGSERLDSPVRLEKPQT